MKTKVLVAALAVAGITVTACGSSGGSEKPGASGLTAITVGDAPVISAVPLHLGIEKGIFKKHGLDVTTKSFNSGPAILTSIYSGQLQFGLSAIVPVMTAATNGLPVLAVAPSDFHPTDPANSIGAVVVKPDSPIKTAADLAGKTIAEAALKNQTDFGLRLTLQDAGLDPSAEKFLVIPPASQIAAVKQGQVDAVLLAEPFLTQALGEGLRAVLPLWSKATAGGVNGTWNTSKSYAQKNPKVVQEFAAAMKEALAYADAHPDEVRTAAASLTKISPDLLAKMKLPTFAGTVDPAQLTAVGNELQKLGFIQKAPPAVSDYFYQGH